MFNPLRWRRRRRALRPAEFFALDDVSFAVERGKTLGVLGTYQSGKSTLAGILGGLYFPTDGKVDVRGTSLLLNSLGSGFKPMLSVWENVRFRAIMLGAPAGELDDFCRRVLEFAELAGCQDLALFNLPPHAVKRLGMAIPLFIDSDVLIVDGLFGAGDPGFREKTLERLYSKIQASTSVIVSSDPDSVASMADAVLVLHQGRVAFLGESSEAVRFFYDLESEASIETTEEAAESIEEVAEAEQDRGEPVSDLPEIARQRKALRVKPLPGLGTVRSVAINHDASSKYAQFVPLLRANQRIHLEIEWTAHRSATVQDVTLGLHAPNMNRPLGCASLASNPSLFPLEVRAGDTLTFRFELAVPDLQAGGHGLSLLFQVPHQHPLKAYPHKVTVFGLVTSTRAAAPMVLSLNGLSLSVNSIERPMDGPAGNFDEAAADTLVSRPVWTTTETTDLDSDVASSYR